MSLIFKLLGHATQASTKTKEATVTERATVTESEPGALLTLEFAGVKVNFRWAPAGSFIMGSPEDEPERRKIEVQHKVELTQGFWIAETPTTQELWHAVMGNNPSHFKGDSQLPVDSVNWDDCQQFIHTLYLKYNDSFPNGFRCALPTEAQWEYACRAGTTTPFSFGSTLNGDKANCYGAVPYGTNEKGERKEQTTPVKSYAPNAWGLYDMHGNVFEWCTDWYAQACSLYSYFIDPTGPYRGRYHVLRGGCWSRSAGSCRSAYRYSGEYLGAGHWLPEGGVGFRLILIPQRVQPVDAIELHEYPNGDESESTRKPGAIKTLEIAGVKVNFHWAPAGTFMMGNPECDQLLFTDEMQHEVTLTKGFWIAETPTTQDLWQAVMGENPSWYTDSYYLPVDSVSWNDCKRFVEELNHSHSLALPCGYQYAMPTEAQWEYACRAGTTTPFSFGTTLNGDKANCDGKCPYGTDTKGEYKGGTTPVKYYAPNTWGLYDMHGNVGEWCADWYGSYDTSSEGAKDPTGTSSGSYRVLRGGSWDDNARVCRSANRISSEPDSRHNYYGFRLVLVR